MSDPLLGETVWVDILEPPAPDPWLSLPLLLFVIVFVTMAMLILWWYWQHLPRQRAQRQLRQLLKQAAQQSANQKSLLHDAIEALRMGCRVQYLAQIRIPIAQQSQWQQFCTHIQQTRFAAKPITQDEVHHAIQQAQYWLRVIPRDA